MAKTSKKTDPKLWEKVKEDVTAGDKGGRPGQWSARKAQMAVQEYKKEGGGYIGPKSENNALAKWTDENRGTKSGMNRDRRALSSKKACAFPRQSQPRSGATRQRGASFRASLTPSLKRLQLIGMVCHQRTADPGGTWPRHQRPVGDDEG